MAERPTTDKKPSSPEEIQQLALAFQRSRAVLTAFELDVFSALDGPGLTSGQLSEKLGTDPRGTDRLLNALCSLGLASKKDGRFTNSELAGRCLVKGRPEYLAGLGHAVGLWRTWSSLTEAVRKGGRVEAESLRERGPDWNRAFIAAMHQRARISAAGVVGRLDLEGVARVLDVGGGSGAFAMAFVQADPRIRSTIFDLPQVLPLARDYVAQAGLSQRVDFVAGDYNADDFGQGFDLVFFSSIIHINSPRQNQALITKAARALNPGGQVVVRDFIMAEDRTEPSFGALFALNMLVGTESGDTYTRTEVSQWLARAGLVDVHLAEREGPASSIVGRKPGD